MEHSTTSKQKDILNTQLNSEETLNKNYSIATNEEVPGTPFRLIQQNNKWFLVMGNNRVTEPTDNKETTLLKLQNEQYTLMMLIAVIVNDQMKSQQDVDQAKRDLWKE